MVYLICETYEMMVGTMYFILLSTDRRAICILMGRVQNLSLFTPLHIVLCTASVDEPPGNQTDLAILLLAVGWVES